MNKLEKKYGKYAISRLSLILIICYACGYLFQFLYPNALTYLYLNPYEIIHHYQIWRLITWIIAPPSDFSVFTLIMLYFYYSIGTNLERTWGDFRYNIYIFSGMIFTIAGSFLLYFYTTFMASRGNLAALELWLPLQGYVSYGSMFSTYYINMSIFLAFAATFPEHQVLFFFFLPIKVKVLGIVYAILLGYQFIVGYGALANPYYNIANRFVIGASLLNFVVFFLFFRNSLRGYRKVKRVVYRAEVPKTVNITRHKCAICGRTDESNSELEFRFCSKCNGNYEYCQDHLFSHEHVK